MDWLFLHFFVISAAITWSEAWSNSPMGMFDIMSPFFNDNPVMSGPFSKLLKKMEQDAGAPVQQGPLVLNDRILHSDSPSLKVRFTQGNKAQDPFSDLLFNFGNMNDEAKKNKKKPHDKVVMSFTELLLPFQNIEREIANSFLGPSFPFGNLESDIKSKHTLKLKKHLKRAHGIHNSSMALPHICRLILNFKSENLSKEKLNHNLGKATTLERRASDMAKAVNESDTGIKNSLFFVQKPSISQDSSFSSIIYSQNKVAPNDELVCVRTDFVKLLLPCLLGTLSLVFLGILILLKKKSRPDYYLKHIEEC